VSEEITTNLAATEAVVEEPVEALVVESAAERLARARMLDRQVVQLRGELEQKWFAFARVLAPIHSDHLYFDLGYKNWTEYIDVTLSLPVTTVSNYLLPWRKLLQSGLDPELAKDVPLNRVNDLADIARANDGRIDPELIEQAISAKTRSESRAFKEKIHEEKERLGIEEIREIKLVVQKSLYDLFFHTTNLVCKLAQEPREKRHEILTLEMALVSLIETPEIQAVIKEEK
jgi:hypothetical protein